MTPDRIITVYTAPSCMQCHATKRHLRNAGVDFKLVDVTTDTVGRFAVEKLGYTTLPVVTVDLPDGLDHWSGYRPDMLDAAIVVATEALEVLP
ncbi:glutaredoxin domain-containing protein [Corynebacterium xerosis]|uniref:glutaredoxin domain-containing protein n=1 Tax=Corynebacterium xerosis TaxID=1725 RepID=UPI00269C1F53|nr:glutaredoxin domain-containing protein [Corynebacterium xerosis]